MAATLVLAPAASAIDKVNAHQLRKGVTVAGIMDHGRALSDIATANDNTQWTQNGPSTFERLSPDPRTFVEGTDYIVSRCSAGGDVTGEGFVAGNTVVPPPGGPGTSVSGCAPSDFVGAAGKIALIQRGFCPFVQNYDNARDAGATAP